MRLSHLSADSQLFHVLARLKEQTDILDCSKGESWAGEGSGHGGGGDARKDCEHRVPSHQTQVETGLVKDAFWKGPGVDEKRVNLVDL